MSSSEYELLLQVSGLWIVLGGTIAGSMVLAFAARHTKLKHLHQLYKTTLSMGGARGVSEGKAQSELKETTDVFDNPVPRSLRV